MAQAIISSEIPILGLDIYCDRINLTFIEMLNREAQAQGISYWLKFYVCYIIALILKGVNLKVISAFLIITR